MVCRHRVLGKANHLWSLIDEQPAKSKRGTGSQRWTQFTMRFVKPAGDTKAQGVLQRGLKVCARALTRGYPFKMITRPAARSVYP